MKKKLKDKFIFLTSLIVFTVLVGSMTDYDLIAILIGAVIGAIIGRLVLYLIKKRGE